MIFEIKDMNLNELLDLKNQLEQQITDIRNKEEDNWNLADTIKKYETAVGHTASTYILKVFILKVKEDIGNLTWDKFNLHHNKKIDWYNISRIIDKRAGDL